MYSGEEIHDSFKFKEVFMLKQNPKLSNMIFEENIDSFLDSDDKDLNDKFKYFLKNGESESKEDYKKIKKKYFKRMGVDKNSVKELTSEEIANSINDKILKCVFSDYRFGKTPMNTIKYLLDYILNKNTIDNYYKVNVEKAPIITSKNDLQMKCQVLINPDYEINIVENNIVKNSEENKKKINYDYISECKLIMLKPLENLDDDVQAYIKDEINSQVNHNEISINFIHSECDTISDDSIENILAHIEVSFYGVKEMWEKFLYESYRLFHKKQYQTSFLVAFTAVDAFIEFLLYNFKKYIENLNIEPNISINSLEELIKFLAEDSNKFIKSKFQNQDDYFWYSQYINLLKPSRRLIDEKLKQILRMIVFNLEKNNVNSFLEKKTIYKNIFDSLDRLEKIRNKLAHGDKVEFNNNHKEIKLLKNHQEEYIQLYAELLISLANLISLLNGSEFSSKI